MARFFVYLFLFTILNTSLVCQEKGNMFLTGIVKDSLSQQAIPGVSIRLVGSNIGTYSQKNGWFRLVVPSVLMTNKQAEITLTSLGYNAKRLVLQTGSHEQDILLQPLPIRLGNVEVIANLSAEQIIRKAIERKMDARKGIHSVSKKVYTKTQIQTSVQTPLKEILSREDSLNFNQGFITENVADIFEKFLPTYTKHTVISQRRQTANMPSQFNILALSEFLNFLDDEVQIASTKFVTPLAQNALNFYQYSLQEQQDYSDKPVYRVSFKPKSTIYPGLIGEVLISVEDYQILAIDIKPTKESGIALINDLSYSQKFDAYSFENRIVRLPTHLLVSIKADFNYLAGLMKIDAGYTLQSIATNIAINENLADSIFSPTRLDSLQALLQSKFVTTVDRTVQLGQSSYLTLKQNVDSIQPLFWLNNTLYQHSAQEEAIYRYADSIDQKESLTKTLDSIIASINLSQQGSSNWLNQAAYTFQITSTASIGINPIISSSRVTGSIYGLELLPRWNSLGLKIQASMDERGILWGQAQAINEIPISSNLNFTVSASAFSRLASIQNRQFNDASSGIFSVNADYLLFGKNFDFYHELGFSFGVGLSYDRFQFAITPRFVEQASMTTFSRNERDNFKILDGKYVGIRTDINWNYSRPLSLFFNQAENTQYGCKFSYSYGQEIKQNFTYQKSEIHTFLLQPSFYSGYTPMYFLLTASAGIATEGIPFQEQFILMRRYSFMGQQSDLMTPGINAFGGTHYLSAKLEHNFSDLFWRFLGLPTHKGRGLELSGFVGTAWYNNTSAPENPTLPRSTGDWYTEIGFGIGRIPIFILDFLYVRFDAAWGISKSGFGNFGYTVLLNLSI